MARIRAIQERLEAREYQVEEERYPFFHRVISLPRVHYQYGVLGDSIVFGINIKEAIVMSFPGATLERLSHDDILEKFLSRSVNGIAIVAGTNNLVDWNGEVGAVNEIADRMETLVQKYQRAGFRVAIVKVPGRVGFKDEIKKLNRKYEKIAKKTLANFHAPRRFHVGNEGGELTGGLSSDGLHPNPEYLQKYSEDIYDALKPLC